MKTPLRFTIRQALNQLLGLDPNRRYRVTYDDGETFIAEVNAPATLVRIMHDRSVMDISPEGQPLDGQPKRPPTRRWRIT